MNTRENAVNQLANLTQSLVQEPKDPLLADLCVPCFSICKKRETPQEAAERLAKCKPPTLFSRLEAKGPYLNAFFSDTFYAKVLDEAALVAHKKQEKQTTWVLEYSQPNPGKPMHLGHIRSTIIGDVLANALTFTGNRVHRLNYLNDRGAHMAELIVALDEFKDLPIVKTEKDLLVYYVKIKAEIESRPELKEKTRQVLEHLNDYKTQLKKIRDMSLKAFQRNYKRLGVNFDLFPLESELEEKAHARVQEAIEKGLAKKEPDGTTIADLENKGLPNTVLLRSNNTPVYLTSDLALADWKFEKFHFNESLIITASEQNLHFKQLQALLAGMGRKYAPHYNHIGFGLIRLSDGKLSTRLGRVILLEDVLEQSVSEAKKQVRADSNGDQIAEAVGVAALKFAVLRTRLEKDITFDPAAETRFEGDTAAYVQYALVRANSILYKNNGKLSALPKKLDLNPAEKHLISTMSAFIEKVQKTVEKKQPHLLCEYALDVAKAFTAFYNAAPVLTAKEDLKAQRLHIVHSAKNVLSLTLQLLGIQTLEKM